MKFRELVNRYKSGLLTEADLEGVSSEDALKLRQEADGGVLRVPVDAVQDEPKHVTATWGDQMQSVSDFGFGLFGYESKKKDEGEDEDEDDGEEEKMASGADLVDYVMVSDGPIPPFNDRVPGESWDLTEYLYRGSPLLYDHNIEESRPPIGRMRDVSTGVKMNRNGQDFTAMTGRAEFASESDYPFAGMIARLVRKGILRGGSVGFMIEDARAPSEEEQDEYGMKPYSTIIEKARLQEYSVTPLGRDINAQLLSDKVLDPIDGLLAEWAEKGVFGDDYIAMAREMFRSEIGKKTKTQVVVPDLVVEPSSSELAASVQELTKSVAESNQMLRSIADKVVGMQEQIFNRQVAESGTSETESPRDEYDLAWEMIGDLASED